jgi:hypothetical protein
MEIKLILWNYIVFVLFRTNYLAYFYFRIIENYSRVVDKSKWKNKRPIVNMLYQYHARERNI